MRQVFQQRISWWQKTRLVVFAACLGLLVAGGLVVSLLYSSAEKGVTDQFGWLAFSLFPLFTVMSIAILARLLDQINMRSGTSSARISGDFE